MIAASSFERFNEREVANAAHQFNAWITSQFLHGEQGALVATAKLVEQVPSVEAKFYGATQVADEARHVEAYARYLDEKLELTYPVNANLRELLELIVADPGGTSPTSACRSSSRASPWPPSASSTSSPPSRSSSRSPAT